MSTRATGAVRAALDAVLAPLIEEQPARRIHVAYSGGVDSTALLLAARDLRARYAFDLRAFHFDHRLHPDSAAWVTHCRTHCAALEIPLRVETVADAPPAGASIEAWARDARYGAAARLLAAGDLLLTAHHRDDIAETLLLAALRGSGAHGLAAIAPRRVLGAGELLRPLLEVSHATLLAAVTEAGVECLSDPSNADPRLDRSFLRTQILPLLAARWPGAHANLARAARLQRMAASVLDTEADAALATAGATATTLPLAALTARPKAHALMVLRRWLRRACGYAPDAALLERVWREVANSRHDATPLVAWRGGEIRRHRALLHWLEHPPAAFVDACHWDLAAPLVLPGGTLHAHRAVGSGVRASLVDAGVALRPRHGGEALRPHRRAQTLTVKRMLQEAGIPPWERRQLPLVYAGTLLLAVADLAIAEEAAAAPGEPGIVFDYARGR